MVFFFFSPKGSLKSIPTFKDQRSVHRKEKLNREQVESHRKLKKQYKRNPSVPRGQGCFMGSVRNNFLRVMRSDWWLRKDQGKFDFFFFNRKENISIDTHSHTPTPTHDQKFLNRCWKQTKRKWNRRWQEPGWSVLLGPESFHSRKNRAPRTFQYCS